MSFELVPLKYEKNSLGFLSENTLNFHHGKHFNAYVETTNKLVAGSNYEGKSLEEIMRTSDALYSTTLPRLGTTSSTSTALPARPRLLRASYST